MPDQAAMTWAPEQRTFFGPKSASQRRKRAKERKPDLDAFGYRDPEALIAIAVLGGCCPSPPGR